MVLAFAYLDNHLSQTIALLEAGEPKFQANGHPVWLAPQRAFHITNTGPRIAALRSLTLVKNDPVLKHLVREFRWAMPKVVKARNFIAHGIIAGGLGDPKIFWSQRRLKQMSVADAVACAPYFDYATRAIMLISWHLMKIVPPFALPDRPVPLG